MKKLLLITMITMLYSCSNENDLNHRIVKNEGYLTIDLKNKKLYLSKNQIQNTDEVYTIKTSQTFELDEIHPSFTSNEATIAYINANLSSISGIYKFYINDIVTYECKVVNGNVIEENNHLNLFKKKYPCTYKGIETCANDRIAAMNWLEKWACILNGLNCVLFEMASCTVDNCSNTPTITQ